MAGIAVVSGKEISLLPKELALLEFLMRHPNQFFTAEVLLEQVWKFDADISEFAVRSTIARLRKKVPNAITTQYGLGYKFHVSTKPSP